MKKLISIIIPVYNEALNVHICYEKLREQADLLSSQYDFEFIFTDNHSTDSTFEILAQLAKEDHRIRVYRFSKNYGYQRSILSGYQQAKGEAAIAFDADLQDPPELLAEFLKKWEEGYKVVYGVRLGRKESKLVTLLRKLFYRIINKLSDTHLPEDAGDFRLIDRVILDQLRKVKEHNLYLRGIISEFGFSQIGLPYHRRRRERGESKFPFRAMFGLAKDGILNHSRVPLRLATYVGVITFLLTFCAIILYVVMYFTSSQPWPPGFATIIILVLFSLSINSLLLGIMGEYLGLIYGQAKERPLTLVERCVEKGEAL